MEGKFTIGKLAAFHTAEKFLLLTHSPKHYRAIGRLVAGAKSFPAAELREKYAAGFMECLKVKATVGKNAGVLKQMARLLAGELPAGERKEIARAIEGYRAGLLPLVVPVTLLRHVTRAHSVDSIGEQSYLDPHPKELMLRNHV